MFRPEDGKKLAQLGPVPLPADDSGITVEFFRVTNVLDPGARSSTKVVFTIPDTALVLSKNPQDFFQWCYDEMMKIAKQVRNFK